MLVYFSVQELIFAFGLLEFLLEVVDDQVGLFL
jgi:hypothetical protein